MSLRRTKSTIISWDGSYHLFVTVNSGKYGHLKALLKFDGSNFTMECSVITKQTVWQTVWTLIRLPGAVLSGAALFAQTCLSENSTSLQCIIFRQVSSCYYIWWKLCKSTFLHKKEDSHQAWNMLIWKFLPKQTTVHLVSMRTRCFDFFSGKPEVHPIISL